MTDMLSIEDKALLRRELPGRVKTCRDSCDKPLGCAHAREYCPDGYDYLLCTDCVKELTK